MTRDPKRPSLRSPSPGARSTATLSGDPTNRYAARRRPGPVEELARYLATFDIRLEGIEHMPAYLIAEHIVTDPAKFQEYVTKVGPMMAKHGARYLTKGSTHKLPEGGHWKPERVVIIEFPDRDTLNTWYNSPEYQPLIALRKSCTSDQDMLFVLEGA
jgi:uncharacterized protein (DUF1330 family)